MAQRKPTSIRMPAELRKMVKDEAKASSQTQQAVLLSTIRYGLAELTRKEKKK